MSANTKLNRIDANSLAANPRATLQAWKQYEPIVIAAMEKHPQPFVYPCSTLRPVTVCSRLRDAIRGKIAFDYPSVLPTLDVARWFGEVIFKYDIENVYIGQAENVRDVLPGTGATANQNNLTFSTLSLEELLAFSLLLSTNKIVGPVIVKIPPDISLLPQRDNLEIVKQNDGSLMLL